MKLLHSALSAAALLALAAPAAANGNSLIINELDTDQGASDTAEFIELFFPGGGLVLDGCFVVLYDGATDTAYDAFELTGQTVSPDGFFVIGPSTSTYVDYSAGFALTNAINDGADAIAIWRDTGTSLGVGDFIGSNVDSPPSAAELVDALVYDTSDNDDSGLLAALTPDQSQIDEDANSLGTTESCSRVGDLTELVTSSYVAQAPTPGAANGTPTGWTDLGFALAGISGFPVLTATGTLDVSSPGTLSLGNARPNAPTYLFVSATRWDFPLLGGTLVPGSRLSVIPLVTNGAGSISLNYVWPGIPVGDDFYIQYWIADSAGILGASASNALMGVQP